MHVRSLEREDPLEEEMATCLPGASVRNSTHDKVMRQSSDGKANQTSGFSPGMS